MDLKRNDHILEYIGHHREDLKPIFCTSGPLGCSESIFNKISFSHPDWACETIEFFREHFPHFVTVSREVHVQFLYRVYSHCIFLENFHLTKYVKTLIKVYDEKYGQGSRLLEEVFEVYINTFRNCSNVFEAWISKNQEALSEQAKKADFLHQEKNHEVLFEKWYVVCPDVLMELVKKKLICLNQNWLAKFLFLRHKGDLRDSNCQRLLDPASFPLEGPEAYATLILLSDVDKLSFVSPQSKKKLEMKDMKPEKEQEEKKEGEIEDIPGALTKKPILQANGKPRGRRVKVLQSLEDWACWWSDDEEDSDHFRWETWSDDSDADDGSDSDKNNDSDDSDDSDGSKKKKNEDAGKE